MDARKDARDKEMCDARLTVAASPWLMLVGLVLFTIAIFCGGCSRKVYVPMERTEARTDTLWKTLERVDTVIDRDTVHTYTRGDSVIVERVRWRVRVRERHDTVYKVRKDSVSVPVPYPVETVKEVEKPLSWWQKTLQFLGWLSVIGIALTLFLCLRKKR